MGFTFVQLCLRKSPTFYTDFSLTRDVLSTHWSNGHFASFQADYQLAEELADGEAGWGTEVDGTAVQMKESKGTHN